MVPDQHRLAGPHGRVEAAGGVGQDDDPGAGDHRGADRVDDLGRRTAFVKVGAPDEQLGRWCPAKCERTQLAVVAGDRRCRESREIAASPARPLAVPSPSATACQPEPRTTATSCGGPPAHRVSARRPACGRELERVRMAPDGGHGARG